MEANLIDMESKLNNAWERVYTLQDKLREVKSQEEFDVALERLTEASANVATLQGELDTNWLMAQVMV